MSNAAAARMGEAPSSASENTRAERKLPGQLGNDMVGLPSRAGLRYNGGTSLTGAQTVRRSGAGPVSDLLGGKASPAALFLHFTSFDAGCVAAMFSNSSASMRKRRSSEFLGRFFSVQRTALSYHLRASSFSPNCHRHIARKNQSLALPPLPSSIDFSKAAIASFHWPLR